MEVKNFCGLSYHVLNILLVYLSVLNTTSMCSECVAKLILSAVPLTCEYVGRGFFLFPDTVSVAECYPNV